MAPIVKKILGALVIILTAGIIGWGKWVTNNALASGQARAADQTAKAAHDTELKRMREAHAAAMQRLKEAQVQQAKEQNAHLKAIRERLRNIEQTLAVHDVRGGRRHPTH
ncbi:hypothetical protein LCGC14_0441420 [marine sediment metagenome]|uniref:Uncharacterized protein n=1 Tax=marine sediment metagenome TaxID=412755 RepID=A0A0F9SKA7_9ZZZZ